MIALLAKSSATPDTPRKGETLQAHTMLVLNAADVLLDRIGMTSLAAMGLPADVLGRLRSIVRVAAFAHDLGKCSQDFQQMVRNPGHASAQLFRHEALSLWLCWPHQHGVLSPWLSGMSGGVRDLKLALLAAAGHHRKFPSKAIGAFGTEVRLFTGHKDFATLLAVGARKLGLEPPPQLQDMNVMGGETSEERTAFESAFRHDTDGEDFTDEELKLLGLAKVLVLDADVAGSALFKAEVGHSWLPDALTSAAGHSLQQLVAKKLDGRAMRPFQDAVAASTAPVTLVRAGCGSGKTLAAWAWGARQHANRQFWLCYPTTGTTTEGYRDYVEGADLHAFIEHGRQAIDVDFFGLTEGHNEEEAVLRDADRLRAMRQWSADAITCTVDTVLGLLQNQRKGLYAWPGLCRSAVVFDEIHAYDESLFGLLLAWIESLPGIPVLLMTASLPADRLHALREVVRRVHHSALAEVDGPAELEQLVRYQRSDEEPDELAQRVLKSGGKVLWVSNTVEKCVAVKSRGAWSSGALLYHSRFRYCDRVIRHRDVVEAFARAGSVLASTTQVAEMSLDLSADLLVTELAPVPALIQRLGRLNRRSTPENPAPVRPFIVVEPEGELPYKTEELQRAREWLKTLGRSPLSQRTLVGAWVEEHAAAVRPTESAWLSGIYATEPMEVRTGSPGVSVLLESDVARVHERPADVVALALPMGPPPKGLLPSLKRVKYHPVVGSRHVAYSEEEGARWL